MLLAALAASAHVALNADAIHANEETLDLTALVGDADEQTTRGTTAALSDKTATVSQKPSLSMEEYSYRAARRESFARNALTFITATKKGVTAKHVDYLHMTTTALKYVLKGDTLSLVKSDVIDYLSKTKTPITYKGGYAAPTLTARLEAGIANITMVEKSEESHDGATLVSMYESGAPVVIEADNAQALEKAIAPLADASFPHHKPLAIVMVKGDANLESVSMETHYLLNRLFTPGSLADSKVAAYVDKFMQLQKDLAATDTKGFENKAPLSQKLFAELQAIRKAIFKREAVTDAIQKKLEGLAPYAAIVLASFVLNYGVEKTTGVNLFGKAKNAFKATMNAASSDFLEAELTPGEKLLKEQSGKIKAAVAGYEKASGKTCTATADAFNAWIKSALTGDFFNSSNPLAATNFTGLTFNS